MTLDRRAAATLASVGLAAGAYRVIARLFGAWLLVAIVAVLAITWTVSLVVPALLSMLPPSGLIDRP